MKYFDFDIRIQAIGSGRYALHAESEHDGEVDAEITFDPDAGQLKYFVNGVETRRTNREFLESLGTELYQRIFVGDVDSIYHRSIGEIKVDPDLGLRIRLRFLSPEFAALPWELLYSRLDKEFMGTKVNTPLVRYLEMPGYKRQLATPFPLRILVAIPRGSDPDKALDAKSETAAIEQALTTLGKNVEVTYLNEQFEDRRVTWQRILDKLGESQFHCFHFIGHGAFIHDQGHLLLDSEDGGDDLVPDDRFAKLFSNTPSVKLVLLNACKGGTLSSSRSLTGSAAQLVKHGVPAVVAMQFDIYDEAAVKFARTFYHSLFKSDERGRVDVAVSRGRHILEAEFPDQRELAAPVLFLHTANGLLFVPETGKLLDDLPKNHSQIDTLEAAQAATDSADEAAIFKRRVTITKRSVQIGLAVAMLLFFMSSIRLLDIFTIDTRAEFLVMAMGNGLTEHPLSDELRIVTLDWEESTPAMRRKVGQVINDLSTAGARTIALDIFYSTENGAFKIDPASGQSLVDSIGRANTSVVVGSKERSGSELQTPDTLRQVVKGIGHTCFESKLGLARSLPIAIRGDDGQYPSLALEAFAVHEGGTVFKGEDTGDDELDVVFPTKPSVKFAVSEVNDAAFSKTCTLVREGDQVSHRFIKLTPMQELEKISMTAAELQRAVSENPQSMQLEYGDRLVLVGVLGANDIIDDMSGRRDGVFWQADAFNNLLLDEAIVPVRNSVQLLIMILLAVVGAGLRLQFIRKFKIGIGIMIFLTPAICLFAVYTYGIHQILINPAYQLLSVWSAWWLAGRTGKKWLR